MRVLMNHRNRPSKDIWNTGDLAFVWRKGKGKTCFSWHGPGHVIGRVGSRIWVSQGLKKFTGVHWNIFEDQVRNKNP